MFHLPALENPRIAVAVCDPFVEGATNSSGTPAITTFPPLSPPSGPRSTIQSAARMTSAASGLNQAALLGLPASLQPAVSGVAANLGQTLGVNLPGRFWDRQAYVGLVTPFGAILLGRQYTPAYEINAVFDTPNTPQRSPALR